MAKKKKTKRKASKKTAPRAFRKSGARQRFADPTPIRTGVTSSTKPMDALRLGMKAGEKLRVAELAKDFEHFETTSRQVPGIPRYYAVEALFQFNRRIVVGLSFTEEGADILLEAFRGCSDHWGEAGWIGRIVEKLDDE